MNRLVKTVMTASVALLVVAGSAWAEQDKPLVVVRFNNDSVQYETPVKQMVKSALEIKSGAFFDVVTIVPETGNSSKDKALKKEAKEKTDKIVDLIKDSGARFGKVRTTYQQSWLASDVEVDIFVQ